MSCCFCCAGSQETLTASNLEYSSFGFFFPSALCQQRFVCFSAVSITGLEVEEAFLAGRPYFQAGSPSRQALGLGCTARQGCWLQGCPRVLRAPSPRGLSSQPGYRVMLSW